MKDTLHEEKMSEENLQYFHEVETNNKGITKLTIII